MYTIIADHSDRLVGVRYDEGYNVMLSPDEQSTIAPFLQLNERLKETLVPVTPAIEFRTELKDSLMAGALQHDSPEQNNARVPLFHRKWVIIGAAAAGSAISVAGIVAAVLLRQRSVAQT